MPQVKFTPEQIRQVQELLTLGHSSIQVQKQMKGLGVSISSRYVRNIRSKMFKPQKQAHEAKKRGRKLKLNRQQIAHLKNFLKKTNPPRLSWLAGHYNVAKSTIFNYKRRMGLKKYKKPSRHFISEATKDKRAKRSWPLYLKLCRGRWQNFITCDEAMFFLDGSYATTNFQYLSPGESTKNLQTMKHLSHPKKLMVWIGFGARGFLTPIFVDPRVKMDARYYVGHILKPMMKEADNLYGKQKWILHQDSAPSHTAKVTQQFLNEAYVRYITREEWLPSSPDCAPCDFWLFGFLKRRIRRRRVTSVKQLKMAIRRELKNIPLSMINRVLESWPKRLREVYKAKGGHIEGFRMKH